MILIKLTNLKLTNFKDSLQKSYRCAFCSHFLFCNGGDFKALRSFDVDSLTDRVSFRDYLFVSLSKQQILKKL